MSTERSYSSEHVQDFVNLLTANQNAIYSFILSRVPCSGDAEDLMQETSITMWKKFDTFEKGTDFFAWGVQIARYKILDFRKRQNSQEVLLNEKTLVALDALEQKRKGPLPESVDNLKQCVDKLPAQLQELMFLRYGQGVPAKSIARRTGKSVNYVYKMLARMQDLLVACMRRLNFSA